MIRQITFSPTGGTRKVADAIACGMAAEVEAYELCNPEAMLSELVLDKDDLAIVAAPVYGGRIPALAVERLKKYVKSNGAKCAVVAVYGNRAYDDALLELHRTATEMGLNVVAAIGAVAEHSIVRQYGSGRPDADDMAVLKAFGEQVMKAEKTLDASALKGNYPYKKASAGPTPKAGNACTGCGLCAKQCPTGAIAPGDPKRVNKDLCASCMRCVDVCPQTARSIGKVMHTMVALAIKKGCAERKRNEIFVQK